MDQILQYLPTLSIPISLYVFWKLFKVLKESIEAFNSIEGFLLKNFDKISKMDGFKPMVKEIDDLLNTSSELIAKIPVFNKLPFIKNLTKKMNRAFKQVNLTKGGDSV